MNDNETPPGIEVSPNAVTIDQLAAAGRSAALVIGALGSILGLLKAHDLVGLIAWLQTSEAATAGSAALAVGAFAWGQWKTRHRAKQVKSVAASPAVPAEVAKLRGS